MSQTSKAVISGLKMNQNPEMFKYKKMDNTK